jgi:hypothetical protein
MLVVIATTLLLRPLQTVMRERMALLRDGLLRNAEDFLGREIEYGSMGPSMFSTLDIRNVRIAGATAASEPLLTVARLRLSYSIISFIQGANNPIHEVQIDSPTLRFDAKQDAALVTLFSSLSENGGAFSLSTLLDDGTRLRLRKGTCLLSSGETYVSLGELSVDATLRQNRLAFQGKWRTQAALAASQDADSPFSFSMENRVTGESGVDFSDISANLRVALFSSNVVRFLPPLTISATIDKNFARFVKVNDRNPFDLSVDYNLESSLLSMMFICKDYVPVEQLSFTGPLNVYNDLLDATVSGAASFSHNETSGWNYNLALEGKFAPDFEFARINPSLAPVDALKTGNLSFILNGFGNEKRIAFDTLALTVAPAKTKTDAPSFEGTVAFQGGFSYEDFAAEGTLTFSNASISGDERFNAELDVAFHDNAVSIHSPVLRFGAVSFENMNANLLFSVDGFDGKLSMMRPGEANVDEIEKNLMVEAFFDYEAARLEMNAVMEKLSPQDALNLLAPFVNVPELPALPFGLAPEQVLVDGSLFLTTDFTQVSYNVSQCALFYGPAAIQLFTCAISGTESRIAMYDLAVRLGEETLIGSAAVDFASIDNIHFSLSASLLDTFYQLRGAILDRSAISIQGAYGLALSVNMAAGAYSGYITVSNFPILFHGQLARASIIASARYRDRDAWSVDLDRLEVVDIATSTSENTSLRIIGRADQDGASFHDMFFNDGLGALNGKLEISWNRDFSFLSADMNMASDAAAQAEVYSLVGVLLDKRLSLRFEGEGVKLAHFTPESYNAVATGSAQIQWTSTMPQPSAPSALSTMPLPSAQDTFSASVTFESLSADIAGTAMVLSASAFLDTDQIEIRDIEIREVREIAAIPAREADDGGKGGAFLIELPLIQVRRDESHVTGTARIRNLDNNVDISCSLGIDFKPIASWFNLNEALKSFNGYLTVDNFHIAPLGIEGPFAFAFERNNSQTFFEGGPRDMIRLRASDKGEFFAALSAPSPIRGSVTGSLQDGKIDASAPNLYVDLATLWDFLPADVKQSVELDGGFVTANVRIAGSLADPEFFGTAHGSSIRMRVPLYLADEIRPVPLTVTLNGNEMSFGPVPAGVGAGQGKVSGWFRFDRWVPNTFKLDISAPPETPLPFAFDIMGVIAQGDTSGTMTLSMENSVLTITADLMAENTDITLDTDKLDASQRIPYIHKGGIAIVTDFTIHSGRKLLFIWPNADFPILQAYAGMGSILKISSDESSGHFSLVGDISMRNGEIFYFQRSFYINEGTLTFNENEVQFEPRISARAELRDQTDTGIVTISMIIDNAPLQSFTARFESNPPLSQAEIFSHMGQNIVGSSDPNDSLTAGTASLGSAVDIVTQTLGLRRAERFMREFSHLDMFSFRTNMAQNAVTSLFQSRGGQQDIVGETAAGVASASGLGNFFDNTTVFLGKYVDSNVFLQTMFSMRYDGNRTAQAQGRVTFYGYAVEADIGIELRSPWVDFRVGIIPIHYEHLFIDDVSFSINFRRSFTSLSDLLPKAN